MNTALPSSKLLQLHFLTLSFFTSCLPSIFYFSLSFSHAGGRAAGEESCAEGPQPAGEQGPDRVTHPAAHPELAAENSNSHFRNFLQYLCVKSIFASFLHPVIMLFGPMQRSHLLCCVFRTIRGSKALLPVYILALPELADPFRGIIYLVCKMGDNYNHSVLTFCIESLRTRRILTI